MKFKVWLVNFGWYLDGEFATLDDAVKRGKAHGFEFAVHRDNQVVAGWSVFGGLRKYRR